MSKIHLLRAAKLLVSMAALCLLAWPGTAAADSVDVATFTFTGVGRCAVAGSCGTSTTVDGSYSFDPDTFSIVGPWSFSTPFGTFSSTDSGAITNIAQTGNLPPVPGGVLWPAGIDLLEFGTSEGGVGLGFLGEGYFGQIVASGQTNGVIFIFSDVLENNPTGGIPTLFSITSGFSTPAAPAAAPEPPSLLLLATGLFGAFWVRRRLSRRPDLYDAAGAR